MSQQFIAAYMMKKNPIFFLFGVIFPYNLCFSVEIFITVIIFFVKRKVDAFHSHSFAAGRMGSVYNRRGGRRIVTMTKTDGGNFFFWFK